MDAFLTILRYHVREGHIQYLLKLRAESADLVRGDDEDYEHQAAGRAMKQIESYKKQSARIDSISCDLGLSYSLLQSNFVGSRNQQTVTLQASQYHTRYSTRYRTRYRIRLQQ
jgi:hypothetical protein